jgi:Methyltransferase domain
VWFRKTALSAEIWQAATSTNNMTSKLFTDIEKIVPTLDGWCDLPKALTLASVILATRPKLTVEVGVFGGRSLIPMAMAVHETLCGFVWAVDPWSAPKSSAGQDAQNAEWWSKCDHEMIYTNYLKGLDRAGVGAVVKTIRSTSEAAAGHFYNGSINTFHLDGNHGEQALADMRIYLPKLAKQCTAVLDDLAWGGGYVGKAADLLLQNGFERRFDLGTGAVFIR